MNYLEDIRQHFEKEYPREGCGILAVSKGKKKWIPCSNIADNDEHFIIPVEEYLKISRTMDIIGIVHSHPDESSEPSEADINNCNAIGKDYYIFSYPDMELTIVKPERLDIDLFGREYQFGVTDCFEAMRDYLSTKSIDIPPRALFKDNWWDKGQDYFSDDTIKEWGHYPVDLKDIQENDVLVFSVLSDINNHCGVYLGDDAFYHHAVSRLSCRESLFPLWHKYLRGAYRYAT
jgi:proteasome lid subunit RPN8/RPN11